MAASVKPLKIVCVGGGSYRLLPIFRGVFAQKAVLDGGEIRLVDRVTHRAEAVGRMLMRTPEYAGLNCKVTWSDDLDRALDGADVLYVTMAVGSPEVAMRSQAASRRRGFLSSDQMSLSGAMLALTAGPTILGFARKMERLCPDAMLLCYANPVAVYSGLVNNHTTIKALGICGGFTNHRWDLTRLLFGKDEYRDCYDVEVAGINHLSFILRGTCEGEELYARLKRVLARPYRMPPCPTLSPVARWHLRYSLNKLVYLIQRFGTVIFSTEGDGMAHLFHEEMFNRGKRYQPPTAAKLRQANPQAAAARAAADAHFRSHLDKELGTAFWSQGWHDNRYFGRYDDDLTIPLLQALAGLGPQKIVASAPNRGAVAGFKPHTVLEFSQIMDRGGPRPLDHQLEVPDYFHGLISALATFQTLTGDAIAEQDPRRLADALFAYPVQFNTRAARAVCRDLLAIHKAEIPAWCQETKHWLKG